MSSIVNFESNESILISTAGNEVDFQFCQNDKFSIFPRKQIRKFLFLSHVEYKVTMVDYNIESVFVV